MLRQADKGIATLDAHDVIVRFFDSLTKRRRRHRFANAVPLCSFIGNMGCLIITMRSYIHGLWSLQGWNYSCCYCRDCRKFNSKTRD